MPVKDGYLFRQDLGLTLLSLLISSYLYKKYHASVALCFLVTAAYGIQLWAYPWIFYNHLGPITVASLGSVTGGAVLTLVLFSCALIVAEEYLGALIPLLTLLAIGDAFMMTLKALLHYGEPWGFMQAWWVMTNGSVDACFLAVMLPVVWNTENRFSIAHKWSQICCLILMTVAIVLSKSNTGIFAALLIQLAYLVSKFKWKALPFTLLTCGIVLLVRMWMGIKFMGDTGRFNVWKISFDFWWTQTTHWLGTGPGTFWVYGPPLQLMHNGEITQGAQIFPWMHNDWLQVLFEQGILGFASILFLFVTMSLKSFKRPVLFSMIMGFGFVATTQYPLRLFFFQCLGVGLIYECFRGRPLSDI